VRDLVLLLHILSAAAWIGAALWLPRDVKRTLALGRPHTEALAARVRPALRLDLGAGIATVITGLAVLGIDARHPAAGIMVGFAAAIVRLAVVRLAMFPAWRAVEARIAAGGDLAPAAAPARRMGMLSGIAHTLWLVALAGMIF
jgi:uncharacterized membrane protein